MVGEPEIWVDDDAEVGRMNRFINWNILKVVLELIFAFAKVKYGAFWEGYGKLPCVWPEVNVV